MQDDYTIEIDSAIPSLRVLHNTPWDSNETEMGTPYPHPATLTPHLSLLLHPFNKIARFTS